MTRRRAREGLAALRRHRGFAAVLIVCAFATGLLFRYLLDDPEQRQASYYLRSGVHAVGIALTGWGAHAAFGAFLQERFRRAPLVLELAARVAFMAVPLAVAAVVLQVALYGPELSSQWFEERLPLAVAVALVMSILFGMLFELKRLVGGRVLKNFILGTYHRPVAEERIIMFLDLEGSTALAERMGELRLHELITRFFFDIDGAIVAHGGEVHSYVGDAVIVTWPVSAGRGDGACLRCFFAIADAIAARAARYEERFGLSPRFRASLHAGPIVASECGKTKRQIAFFGDAMNVAARLEEYGKAAGERLVVSRAVLAKVDLPDGLEAGPFATVPLRGREAPIEVASLRRRG